MEKSNVITSFGIGSNTYKVLATDHAIKRLESRGLDKYYIASACLALGEKLNTYNNSGNQIMLIDKGKVVSSIIAVEDYTIVVITVLAKANPYIKESMKASTIIENFVS
jgi:putative NADH-flavin reductase